MLPAGSKRPRKPSISEMLSDAKKMIEEYDKRRSRPVRKIIISGMSEYFFDSCDMHMFVDVDGSLMLEGIVQLDGEISIIPTTKLTEIEFVNIDKHEGRY